MHYKRLIIAGVFVPLLYMYVMYLPPYYFLFLITFISTIGLAEFYAMYKVRVFIKYTGIIWGAVLLFVFFMRKDLFIDTLLLSVLALTTIRLLIKKDPHASFADISPAVFGLLYIPGLLTFQLSLIKSGPAWIVLLYAAVWGADSAAYYVGKSLGKRKLYVEMSPNKTVAGAVGSVIGGVIGAMLIKFTLLNHVTIIQTIILGSIVGFTTIFGDLVESMFKRDVGVKDSGNILPGHGGFLDKLDGVTFAGPAFYWGCMGLGLIQ